MRSSDLSVRLVDLVKVLSGMRARREKRLRGNLVLAYHGLERKSKNDGFSTFQLSVRELRKHLKFLTGVSDVVSVSDMMRNLGSGSRGNPFRVAITFDDAFRDQVNLAGEIMENFQLPWALALPAGNIEAGRTLFAIEIRFASKFLRPNQLQLADGLRVGSEMLSDDGAALVGYLMGQCSSDKRERILEEILLEIEPGRVRDAISKDGRFVMATWADVKMASQSGAEILSHGLYHRVHNKLISNEHRQVEIYESKELIHTRLGICPAGFVFPHGKTNLTSESLIVSAGYEFAMTCAPGFWKGSDPYSVPRTQAEMPLSSLRRTLVEAQ